MSEEKNREPFLDRWSRLKKEPPANPAEKPAAAAVAPPPAQPLPPVEKLTPESDFAPFMGAKVDPGMRRAALKKLFTDAHFSLPDPFEPYSIDLTVAESIPEEMLKNLRHSKRLLFDEPDKAAGAEAGGEATAETRTAQLPQDQPPEGNVDLENVAGKQDA